MKPCVCLLAAITAMYSISTAAQPKQLADYVDTNIGGIGILLTSTAPLVQYPHGMMRVAPITTPGTSDRYLADRIYGFPAGPALLMATSQGDVSTDPAHYSSSFDHDFESATPYYYAVRLDDSGIRADLTTTRHAALYRFSFPKGAPQRIVLSLNNRAMLTVVSADTVQGSREQTNPLRSGTAATTREYFCAQFSSPFRSFQSWQGDHVSDAVMQMGDKIGFITGNFEGSNQQIEVRAGISYISADQACRNVRSEVRSWAFDSVKAHTREVWNQTLGKIAVMGGSERQRSIFYTALYRSLCRMSDITEDGRYFSGFDGRIHSADGHNFYVDDGLWDTYRSEHPLQLLIEPRVQEDIVRSYLRMYEQSGWLPSFPSVEGELAVMIGHHAAALIADTYMKGYRDFDIKEAYSAMKKDALEATMLPWTRGPLTSLDDIYFDKGFFPALSKGEREMEPRVHRYERRQSVSITLESSYDDWCLAQIAKDLGETADYTYFMKLARNYENVFDPNIGFMAPKGADGNWVEDFDPKLDGGPGARDYFTEVNSWIYTFNVQHDPAGLIRLIGGRDAFNAKLDRLFVEQPGVSKFEFFAQFPDATGLVGLYAQGNEPSFHIPYLYDFSGQPWKTQKRVRELMDVWYGDGPMGIPGDDDGGATSSWYVFSSIGFYPVCPGSPVYEIGSPIFEQIRITLENGKLFTIEAPHVSAQNKYIQSASLNGKPLNQPWFRHADIAQGGSLILVMGPEPNPRWGSAPDAAPPSMSPNPASSPVQRP